MRAPEWLTAYLRAGREELSIAGHWKINIRSCLPRIYRTNLTRHWCGRDYRNRWLEMNFSSGRREVEAITSRRLFPWMTSPPRATALATFVADFPDYLTRNEGIFAFPPAARSDVSEGYDCAVRELSCVRWCSRDLRGTIETHQKRVGNNVQNEVNPSSEREGCTRDIRGIYVGLRNRLTQRKSFCRQLRFKEEGANAKSYKAKLINLYVPFSHHWINISCFLFNPFFKLYIIFNNLKLTYQFIPREI